MPQYQNIKPDRTRYIYVMDDEPAILKAMNRMLTAKGHRCCTSTRGEDLLNTLRTTNTIPDVAILDIKIIGGMGGIDTAQGIHALHSGMPVISMSGYPIEIILGRKEERALFAAHLEKPFSAALLSGEIERVCEGPL